MNLTELIMDHSATDNSDTLALNVVPVTTFNLYFDGGGNGEFAYGSWQITWNNMSKTVQRESYRAWRDDRGRSATSNCSEYLALLGALQWLQSVKEKQNYQVHIQGDSQLVINQLSGRYRCHKEHLRILHDDCLVLLAGFKEWRATWKPRIHNVRRFGH